MLQHRPGLGLLEGLCVRLTISSKRLIAGPFNVVVLLSVAGLCMCCVCEALLLCMPVYLCFMSLASLEPFTLVL